MSYSCTTHGWIHAYNECPACLQERLKVFSSASAGQYQAIIGVDLKHYRDLETKITRLEKALSLAMYYVEGDATYEALKEQVDKILKGEK